MAGNSNKTAEQKDNPLTLGFVGLGDMGGPISANLARSMCTNQLPLHVFDIALQADKVPASARVADSIADIASRAQVIFMSVPDGKSSLAVVEGLLAAPSSRLRCLVNLSTVGIEENRLIMQSIPAGTFDYIDAPVSGGKAGAIKGSLTIMWSGSRSYFDELQSILSSFAGSVFFVGDTPGQGQALKLLNNYLSGVALTATSEAVRFGLHHGLDMKTLLDVVHVSTGQNVAVSDKFPNRILGGSYDAGFRMALMQKDISLYQQSVKAAGLPSRIIEPVSEYWQEGLDRYPDGDFTEIFKTIDSTPDE